MNRDAHLRLAFAGMHPDRKGTELAKRGGPEQILGAIVSKRLQVPDHARQAVAVPADQRRVELAEMGVSVLMPGDAGYPGRLAAIPDRPDVLFVRGALPPDAGVAVVGSRRATRYGKTLAGAFGHALGRRGWAVVSGLARGIDAAAHQGAVDAAATAVGVLGCGIDRWYPAGNAALGRQILATGGAIVSEYPPGTPPDGWRFPPRNRIISGLAGVVVVVEAAVKGGALITARTALEQGRDVFAVPGDLERTTSVGCNLLIRDGAWPLMGVEDLVESVERVLGPSPAPAPAPGAAAEATETLLELVGVTGRSIDSLAESTGRPVREILAEVSRLEARDLVSLENSRVMLRR